MEFEVEVSIGRELSNGEEFIVGLRYSNCTDLPELPSGVELTP